MPKQRENWASKLGFILAGAGSAVGLGNIWRFPYVVGTNGGAVFVLIYLVVVFLIGYPMMVTETALGKHTRRNPVGAFKALAPNSPWWLAGALGVFTGFVILSYYSVVAGWSLSYIFKTLLGAVGPGVDTADAFIGHITSVWPPIIWHAVFMLLTVGIIAAGIVKGIQRWVQILWPVMTVLIVLLIIRAVTLPGAGAGIAFFLAPDFGQVTGVTFLNAVAQAFFTLSLGMGVFITYGSYLKQDDNISGSAGAVVGMDTLVALLAGFVVFPAVFAMGLDPSAGAGLTFITLPAVFAEMPAGVLFGTLFFILLAVAALTSAISLLEVVAAWLIDEMSWSRAKAAVVLGVVIFVVGIPSSLGFSVWSGFTMPGLGTDLLDTYDWFANSIFLPLGGLLTAIFAGYVWGAKNVQQEANHGVSRLRIGNWLGLMIRIVIPVAILVVMIWGIIETFAG